MNKTVYIRKLDKDFSKDKLSAHLKESISKIGLDKDFSNAKSIFIKLKKDMVKKKMRD